MIPRSSLDPSELPSYQYQDLGTNEIRFVILLRGKEHEDVNIEIEHASIDSDQAYAALSYVWGDKKKLEPVFVRNSRVQWVTYNLWAALRRIRQKDKDLVLWVDAICINQADDTEKSRQIQHMPLIYPGADRVLCWLGDDNDATVLEAFNLLKLWVKAHYNPVLLTKLVAKVREQLASGPSGQSKALAALFTRPYWRRAWCLQEVCVEPSKPPTLLCGRHELSWDILHTGFFCLGSNLERHETWSLIGSNVEYVLPMLSTSWRPSVNMELSDLIPRVSRREASISHDMIFSLLGLAERGHAVEYPLPDYTRTIEETCVVFTRAIIKNDRRLCILNVVDSFREDDKVPSWSIKPGRWSKNRASDFDALDIHIYGPMYRATMGSTPYVEEPSEKSDTVLRLIGLELDRVCEVFDQYSFLSEALILARSWTEIMDLCSDFCSAHLASDMYFVTGEPMVQAFLRTMTCDDFWIHSGSERHWQFRDRFNAAYQAHMHILRDDENSIKMEKAQLIEYLASMFRFCLREPEVETEDQAAKGERANQGPHGFLERRACAELLRTICDKVGKRKFIVTEKGYLGVGPPECAPGDIACLFPGSTVPLMLRQAKCEEERRYLLVGDAYVHGVMYGEALQSKSTGGKSTTMSSCEGWSVISIE